jgi:hypothetical protein
MRKDDYGFAARLLFAAPVIGWMLREIADGNDAALGWFALFAGSAVGVSALAFGLPGMVLVMLCLAALSLGAILLVTRG